MQEVARCFIKKKFIKENFGKTIDFRSEMFKNFKMINIPPDSEIDDYEPCEVIFEPIAMVPKKIKITKIIKLDDILKEDRYYLIIEFFIHRFRRDWKTIKKIIRSANQKYIINIIETLSNIEECDPTYVLSCLRRCPKHDQSKMVKIICNNFCHQNHIQKYLYYIFKNYTELEDLDAIVQLLVCITSLKIDSQLRDKIAGRMFAKIERNQQKLSRENLKLLIYHCKAFAFSKRLCEIIYEQIYNRFNNDIRLIYSFMIHCKYKVDELFKCLCENDKSGYYTSKIIQYFPYVNKQYVTLIQNNVKKRYTNKVKNNLEKISNSSLIGGKIWVEGESQ